MVVFVITREGQTFTGKTFNTPAYLNIKAQLLLFSLIFKKQHLHVGTSVPQGCLLRPDQNTTLVWSLGIWEE